MALELKEYQPEALGEARAGGRAAARGSWGVTGAALV